MSCFHKKEQKIKSIKWLEVHKFDSWQVPHHISPEIPENLSILQKEQINPKAAQA